MTAEENWRKDIVTKTARIYLTHEGVVRVDVNIDARQTLENAVENMAAAIECCGPKKRPLLTDIRKAFPMQPEARRYYSGKVLIDNFLAIAILVDTSPVGKMMANIFLRIARPLVPSRMFFDEASATKWLTEFSA